VKEFLKRWLLLLLPDMQDVLVFGGLGCACWGIAQIYSPAAWIVAGAAMIGLGLKR
jgi:hypothetical protein